MRRIVKFTAVAVMTFAAQAAFFAQIARKPPARHRIVLDPVVIAISAEEDSRHQRVFFEDEAGFVLTIARVTAQR